MKKIIIFIFPLLYLGKSAHTQVQNAIIITTDGLRWQELFKGIDTAIANNRRFNEGDSSYIYEQYGHIDPLKSREKIFPFFWKKFVDIGSLYGNRNFENNVNVANPHWFSYPGYSELFTGFADAQINSNSYPPNPHVTLLEFLNQQPGFKNKIAAFGAWNAFDRILNQQRSGLPVYNAFDTVGGKLTPQQKIINQMLVDSYKPWKEAECLDVFTHYAAAEYLKTHQPKVLYIGYGETDEWAHAGKYRSYLDAAHQFDQWVNELWNYLQSSPMYKNKTALFITTDHGRGDSVKAEWTGHGSGIKGSDESWFTIVAPGLYAKGEVKTPAQYHTRQFAQTIAHLLGTTYKGYHPISEKIELE